MNLEKDEIIVNLAEVKADLFDKVVKAADDEEVECDDVVVEILNYANVLDVIELHSRGLIDYGGKQSEAK